MKTTKALGPTCLGGHGRDRVTRRHRRTSSRPYRLWARAARVGGGIAGDGREAYNRRVCRVRMAPLQMEGLMRLFVAFVIVAVALGYMVKSTTAPSSAVASLLTVTVPASTSMSPHEIHLNYKAMKDLPVHDST